MFMITFGKFVISFESRYHMHPYTACSVYILEHMLKLKFWCLCSQELVRDRIWHNHMSLISHSLSATFLQLRESLEWLGSYFSRQRHTRSQLLQFGLYSHWKEYMPTLSSLLGFLALNGVMQEAKRLQEAAAPMEQGMLKKLMILQVLCSPVCIFPGQSCSPIPIFHCSYVSLSTGLPNPCIPHFVFSPIGIPMFLVPVTSFLCSSDPCVLPRGQETPGGGHTHGARYAENGWFSSSCVPIHIFLSWLCSPISIFPCSYMYVPISTVFLSPLFPISYSPQSLCSLVPVINSLCFYDPCVPQSLCFLVPLSPFLYVPLSLQGVHADPLQPAGVPGS